MDDIEGGPLGACNRLRVKKLYLSAFPKEERVPWRLLLKRYGEGKCLIETYGGNTFVGFSVTIEREDFAYVFFLAVSDNARSRGFGGKILDRLAREYAGKPLVLDMERVQPSPNYEQRVRRRGFYLRNGFSTSGFCYEQNGVQYETLYRGENFSVESYKLFVPERVREFLN